MPFIETEAKKEIKEINGKPTVVLTPECEVTLKNLKTGQEYMSDAEAIADVNDPNTDTKQEHLRRDVKITVEALPLGGDSKL